MDLPSLPFNEADAGVVQPAVNRPRRPISVKQVGTAQKTFQLYWCGGLVSLGIGLLAMQFYSATVDQAAAVASVWLVVTYLIGRGLTQWLNSLILCPPPEPLLRDPWVTGAAWATVIGLICWFLAATSALSAGLYLVLNLRWAIQPALAMCGLLASGGLGLVVSAGMLICIRAGMFDALVSVARYELLTLTIELGASFGSYNATRLRVVHHQGHRLSM
ncbi:MAG: hypothetical protein ABL986_19040 [Vicinamibacterales bacterium]